MTVLLKERHWYFPGILRWCSLILLWQKSITEDQHFVMLPNNILVSFSNPTAIITLHHLLSNKCELFKTFDCYTVIMVQKLINNIVISCPHLNQGLSIMKVAPFLSPFKKLGLKGVTVQMVGRKTVFKALLKTQRQETYKMPCSCYCNGSLSFMATIDKLSCQTSELAIFIAISLDQSPNGKHTNSVSDQPMHLVRKR